MKMTKMRKTLIIAISYLLLAACTAWGQDAMHFFNLGMNSSMAYNKIQHFTKALELNPVYADAFSDRGVAYYYNDQFYKACSDWKRACELGLCANYEWAKINGVCK